MPSLRVRPPLRQDDISADAGFTVLEALVSFVLFAVIGGASLTAVVNATRTSNNSDNRVSASQLAQQDLQQARALRYPNYPTAVAAHGVTVGGTTYTVSRAVPSVCPATSNYDSQTTMLVTTTVTWPPTNANNRVIMATEISC